MLYKPYGAVWSNVNNESCNPSTAIISIKILPWLATNELLGWSELLSTIVVSNEICVKAVPIGESINPLSGGLKSGTIQVVGESCIIVTICESGTKLQNHASETFT